MQDNKTKSSTRVLYCCATYSIGLREQNELQLSVEWPGKHLDLRSKKWNIVFLMDTSIPEDGTIRLSQNVKSETSSNAAPHPRRSPHPNRCETIKNLAQLVNLWQCIKVNVAM